MKIVPISYKPDLREYHASVGSMARTSTGASTRHFAEKILYALKSDFGINDAQVFIGGSDGRGENPIFLRQESPGEIIVTAETKGIFSEEDLPVIQKELFRRGFHVHELKGTESTRMFYNGNPKAVFPTRTFDAVIAHNFLPSPIERQRLFAELRSHSGKIIRRFTERVSDARKAMLSGTSRIGGENRIEIDPGESAIHYDRNRYLNGVKTGPLRFIQYGLMKFIIQRVRGGQAGEIDLMLPSGILDRIDMLSSSGILRLSSQETEDLKFIYGYFLYMHHMIQLGNIETGQTVFEIDRDNMKDMFRMFTDLEKIMEQLLGES